MAKARVYFECTECGYESVKWMGRCPSCGNWNCLEERTEAPAAAAAPGLARHAAQARPLREIPSVGNRRIFTGMGELDRVLGGGIVAGSVILAGGEPGIGKSTLFLQAADALAEKGKVLYVSGEESGEQVRLRAERLGLKSEMLFLAETQLEAALACAEAEKPSFLIVDSIQTMASAESTSGAGSVSQVRACAASLARYAKTSGAAVFIIGHVTKDGAIAGPRVLEHLVDTVLYFEGERFSSFRILRAVKNRFGSTNEIGVFEMGDGGMREVKNPSAMMLSSHEKDVAGACVFASMEGTRPVLVEVEALVSTTAYGMAKRQATGLDYNRMSLIIAVLEKKIGLKLYDQDIFVNVGGGMRIQEPALDLAVAAGIVSSLRNKPIPGTSVFFGEIGLTGELRHISQAEKRLGEAERMGMAKAVLPYANAKAMKKHTAMQIVGAKNLGDALAALFH